MPAPRRAREGIAVPAILEFSDNSGTTNDNLTNDTTPTLSGTSAPSVEVRILSGSVLLGVTRSDEAGNWTFTTSALPDGLYGFRAETGQGADRRTSDPFEVEIDTGTSVPEITSADEVPDGGLELVGTAEAGTRIGIFDDRAPIGTTMAHEGHWSFVVGGDAVNYTVVATDLAGNSAYGTFSLTSLLQGSSPGGDTPPEPIPPHTVGGTSSTASFREAAPDGDGGAPTPPDADSQTDGDTADATGSTQDGPASFAITPTAAIPDAPPAAKAANATGATPTVFETRVASSSDDAEERQSKGRVTLDSSDLEMTQDGSKEQTVGIRFTGIDIPQGAIITSAYIQFQTDEVDTGPVSLTIRGDDSDDAAVFTNTNWNISSRANTDAAVAWTPADWLTKGEAGADQRTPDLAAIIQEIVNRGGWTALNDLAFIITGSGSRTAEAFDGEAEGAPLLHVEWLSGGPEPTITTPAAVSVAENQTAVLDIEANDNEDSEGAGLTYSISGGADSGAFTIDPSNGVLSFTSAPSYETPTDANGDNDYLVQVTVTDSDGLTDVQDITVTVIDQGEPPVLDLKGPSTGTGNAVTYLENAPAVAVAPASVTITDEDDTHLTRAVISLSNPQPGDTLDVNTGSLPAGIGVDPASTASQVILTGSATLADYEAALQQVLFRNTSDTPGNVSRTIDVTVEDGVQISNTAQTTVSIDRAPDPVDDNETTPVDTAVVTANVLANDDPGDGPASISTFDTLSVEGGTVAHNGDGTFTYTPPTGLIGIDSFTYTAADSDGDLGIGTVTITVGDRTPFVFESRILTSSDDAEERGSSDRMSLSSSDLEMSYDRTKEQTVGLRFTGIDIPKGAIITDAHIQFQADEVDTGPVSLTIRGEDTDDAATFTSTAQNIFSRVRTDASVEWTPADWTVVGEAGPDQQTPNLAAIVQEIVNRSGWSSLNDMVFMISGTGTRTAEAFDGDEDGAALLHVEWVPAGPVTDPVSFNTPPDSDPGMNQIGELAAAGAAVGITADADDPDPGHTVTFSIDDPRFTIHPTTGVITRSGTGTLDAVTEPFVTLSVRADSSDFSSAVETFVLAVQDDPEPVAFDTPADSNPTADRIAEAAVAGTSVGITASASDPDPGDSVSYSIDDARFTIDATTGVITRSGSGTLNALSEPSITLSVTATSTDGSITSETFGLSVVGELLPTGLGLVNSVDASLWSPPAPDTSGIVFIEHLGSLLVSDGEVNEIPTLFTGDNLFRIDLDGTLQETLTTIGFSDEPAGITYNPTNRHLFISDDSGPRGIYELDPGPDGNYDTVDDSVTYFSTGAFGSTDPEGLAYDTSRDVLYIVDGVGSRIYTLDPGTNGVFDGVSSEGGDDIVFSFDSEPLGISDPEGIAYDPVFDALYVTASDDSVAMITTTGELLATFDTSAANVENSAGLTLGPSSGNASQRSLYMVARGEDNDSVPDENDGVVYEFELLFDDPLLA
ncbi:cadherin domain-containing protein [Aliiruegeria haliotis]|uniref:Cadherin domain-containing protein n=1 Tax=Aliiruegeria haliotis TaxID=1280846 RepID=A0A2T0RTC5_9RHOB|nr:cadherin domain-containing protein [Aliiruegeria haliotis]PRY24418.1 cadherin domain-containing protein [Aliiruegeria haliotis]